MTAIHARQIARTFPMVSCPGCQTPMDVLVTESIPHDLNKIVYRCDSCGTETERIVKRG